MSMATIEVAFANPPREGKKMASVKTADGQMFLCWPDQLGLLQPGRSYKVEYSESTFNGRTFQKIVKVEPIAEPPAKVNGTKPPAPSASTDAERKFVTTCLAALISTCSVGMSSAALADGVRMLRAVYRETMG